MSSTEVQYVETTEDGKILILEEGFISKSNINDMTFTFDNPSDITENLNKKSTQESKKIAITHNGRTGYAGLTCTYPNKKDTSSKVVLTDCVIQYIVGITSPKSTYARTYVFVGIPDIYISKISTDALNNSGVHVKPKDKTNTMSGYYWISCNLDKLEIGKTCIYYTDNQGAAQRGSTSLLDVLTDFKCHVTADVVFTVSATITSKTMVQDLDLVNGQYYLTMKPTEIYMKSETTVEAPKLEDLEKRKNEGADPSEKFLASAKLAQFAMRNLKIG